MTGCELAAVVLMGHDAAAAMAGAFFVELLAAEKTFYKE